MAVNKVWKFKGQTLDFDCFDPEHSKRFESAYAKYFEILRKGHKAEEKEYCRAVIKFFTEIFGKKTVRDLFNAAVSKRECADAVTSFFCFLNEQKAAYEKEINAAIEKYARK